MAKKYETSKIMGAILAACPDAKVVVLNFDDEEPNADMAMTVEPRVGARAMRSLGNTLCGVLEIPSEEVITATLPAAEKPN